MILVCAATERELDACLVPWELRFADLPAYAPPIAAGAGPGVRHQPMAGKARLGRNHLFAVTGVGIPMTLARLIPLATAVRPELIVNVGIAGAYPQTGLDIGCVATGSDECFGDVGVEMPGPDPFTPVSKFPWADAEYREPLRLASGSYRPPEALFPGMRPSFPVRMAKGCTVNRCTGLEETGRSRRDTFAAEFESMEGAAAALAGWELGIPVCEVRAISNIAAARDMRPENIALALGNLGVYMGRWLGSMP